jgi:hypothetical protein
MMRPRFHILLLSAIGASAIGLPAIALLLASHRAFGGQENARALPLCLSEL